MSKKKHTLEKSPNSGSGELGVGFPPKTADLSKADAACAHDTRVPREMELEEGDRMEHQVFSENGQKLQGVFFARQTAGGAGGGRERCRHLHRCL